MCARLGWVRRAIAAALVVAAAAVFLLTRGGDEAPGGVPFVPTPPGEVQVDAPPLPDPFAWDPARAEEFERRAAAGNSHPLYALSPGGAIVSAERTARWRPQVERAAAEAGVDPDTLEGLVFLESAGREDARAPGSLESAAGLTQILAETAQNLLGMEVDLAASERITRRIARAERRGERPARDRAAARPRAGRPALRRGARARRHGALPGARPRALPPRGPRVRLLPHGHRQPRERAARLRGRRGGRDRRAGRGRAT